MKSEYTFEVAWSEGDGEYVGLCKEFPSLSWLDSSQKAALKGITKMVKDISKDLKSLG